MLGLCVTIILIVIFICVTVVSCRIIEKYDLRDLLLTRNRMMTVKKMIFEKIETGDNFSTEEVRIMYRLLTRR